MSKLLIATRNVAKLQEFASLLDPLPYQLATLAEEGIDLSVEEIGTTFRENAALKATQYASASHLLTLADDSGLEVTALHDEPGVLSARYAGVGASDAKLCEYLLSKMASLPWDQRQARFRCVIAIATPSGVVRFCEGECRGMIAFEPRGSHGFGYDPLFYFPDLDKTMAELSPTEKNRLSHRARAAVKAREILCTV